MQVNVRVKPGAPFNRKEQGVLVTYEAGSTLTVSQHVYEKFADRFEVIGDPPPSKVRRLPSVPGTDDERPEPAADKPRIIVTGRPEKPAPKPEDEKALKTGDEAGSTAAADEPRASPKPASGAGNGASSSKPKRATTKKRTTRKGSGVSTGG